MKRLKSLLWTYLVTGLLVDETRAFAKMWQEQGQRDALAAVGAKLRMNAMTDGPNMIRALEEVREQLDNERRTARWR